MEGLEIDQLRVIKNTEFRSQNTEEQGRVGKNVNIFDNRPKRHLFATEITENTEVTEIRNTGSRSKV